MKISAFLRQAAFPMIFVLRSITENAVLLLRITARAAEIVCGAAVKGQ